ARNNRLVGSLVCKGSIPKFSIMVSSESPAWSAMSSIPDSESKNHQVGPRSYSCSSGSSDTAFLISSSKNSSRAILARYKLGRYRSGVIVPHDSSVSFLVGFINQLVTGESFLVLLLKISQPLVAHLFLGSHQGCLERGFIGKFGLGLGFLISLGGQFVIPFGVFQIFRRFPVCQEQREFFRDLLLHLNLDLLNEQAGVVLLEHVVQFGFDEPEAGHD